MTRTKMGAWPCKMVVCLPLLLPWVAGLGAAVLGSGCDDSGGGAETLTDAGRRDSGAAVDAPVDGASRFDGAIAEDAASSSDAGPDVVIDAPFDPADGAADGAGDGPTPVDAPGVSRPDAADAATDGGSACVVVTAEKRVTTTATNASGANLRWDPAAQSFVLAWSVDGAASARQILAARLDAAGNVVGAASPVTAGGGRNGRPLLAVPPAASAAAGLRLAYEAAAASGARIASSVLALNASLAPLAAPAALDDSGATDETRPGVAFAGAQPFAVWTAAAAVATGDAGVAALAGRRIVVAAIDATSGAPLAAPAPRVFAPAGGTIHPVLARGGTGLGMVRVEADRVLLDVLGADLSVVKETVLRVTPAPTNPTLGWDGSRWIAAWEDYERDSEDPDVFFARADAAGTLLAPASRLQDPTIADANWPSVDSAAGLSVVASYAFINDAEILVNLIDSSGQVRRPGLRVSTSPGRARLPSIAYNARDGQWGVAWVDTRYPGAAPGTHSEIMFASVRCAP